MCLSFFSNLPSSRFWDLSCFIKRHGEEARMEMKLWYIRERERKNIGRGDRLRWPCDSHLSEKLTLTSQTSGGRSVDVVLLRTNCHEVFCFFGFFWFHFFLFLSVFLSVLSQDSLTHSYASSPFASFSFSLHFLLKVWANFHNFYTLYSQIMIADRISVQFSTLLLSLQMHFEYETTIYLIFCI